MIQTHRWTILHFIKLFCIVKTIAPVKPTYIYQSNVLSNEAQKNFVNHILHNSRTLKHRSLFHSFGAIFKSLCFTLSSQTCVVIQLTVINETIIIEL